LCLEPREQGQGAARENAALMDWPLCEESNLANRVRSPMPGRRDRENRVAEQAATREYRRAIQARRRRRRARRHARPLPDTRPSVRRPEGPEVRGDTALAGSIAEARAPEEDRWSANRPSVPSGIRTRVSRVRVWPPEPSSKMGTSSNECTERMHRTESPRRESNPHGSV
jgi:hypothetical protein